MLPADITQAFAVIQQDLISFPANITPASATISPTSSTSLTLRNSSTGMSLGSTTLELFLRPSQIPNNSTSWSEAQSTRPGH